jgi:acyl-coenzyme A synthetase/AMP-(fatty) acid ligase
MQYADVCHTYGLARAGYIPQMFSLRLPNPDVIYELMGKANAKALIFDPSSQCPLENSPVPTYPALSLPSVEPGNEELPSITAGLTGSDTFCIFHTSGSTSGIPKVVFCSSRRLIPLLTYARTSRSSTVVLHG